MHRRGRKVCDSHSHRYTCQLPCSGREVDALDEGETQYSFPLHCQHPTHLSNRPRCSTSAGCSMLSTSHS